MDRVNSSDGNTGWLNRDNNRFRHTCLALAESCEIRGSIIQMAVFENSQRADYVHVQLFLLTAW